MEYHKIRAVLAFYAYGNNFEYGLHSTFTTTTVTLEFWTEGLTTEQIKTVALMQSSRVNGHVECN